MKRTAGWMVAASLLALALSGAGCRRDGAADATDTKAEGAAASAGTAGEASDADAPVYQTYGAHNPPGAAGSNPCATPDCVYPRRPGEPADPLWPAYWQSGWTMYRAFGPFTAQRAAWNPPPWPDEAAIGSQYQKSTGASYYDSTWRGPSGEGMMVESYNDFCLPIFPIPNQFSCKFISLGDTAYFVAGEGPDRPAWMKDTPVCLFSKQNHPPRRDFVKHLPYSASDSARIGAGGQAYSFWVCGGPGGSCTLDNRTYQSGEIMQAGASPDLTAVGGILFGYGFGKDASGALVPQSFYFSGFPAPPANAPMVSQNYTGFRATRPDPAVYADVADLDPATLPVCELFDPPDSADVFAAEGAGPRPPTWADIGRASERGSERGGGSSREPRDE